MKRAASVALAVALMFACLTSCYEEVTVPASTTSSFDKVQYADNGKPKIVYWAKSGKRIHINPNCYTLENGAISGSLELAKAAGREGWCSKCSKGWSDERFEKKGNPYAED